MTSKLDEALDAIWRTAPEGRVKVASEVLTILDRAEIDLLTAWDCSASIDAPTRGTLVEVSNSDERHAIVYTDLPWARNLDERRTTEFHAVASLLCIAQYARDLLDSDLLTYPAERTQRIRTLSAQVGVEEDIVRRLLANFDRDVRNMA